MKRRCKEGALMVRRQVVLLFFLVSSVIVLGASTGRQFDSSTRGGSTRFTGSPGGDVLASQAPSDSIMYHGRNLSLEIPDFWSDAYWDIGNVSLNFTRVTTRTATQQPDPAYGITLPVQVNITHVTYTPGLWNGTSMTIDGDLYEPAIEPAAGTAPALLYMHGLFGEKSQGSFDGMRFAARGGVCLCISLPGHGLSDGPVLLPEIIFNYTMTGEGRKWPIFFYGVQAGIGGLNALSNLTPVNSSFLNVIGGSWGGLHAQLISGVEHDIRGSVRLKNTIVYIASGDLLTCIRQDSITNIMRPTSLNGAHPGEFEYALMQDWDPLIYAAQVPSIHYIIGTNDDFFVMDAFRTTLDAIRSRQPSGYIGTSIIPGGHHDPGVGPGMTGRLLRVQIWGDDVSFPNVSMNTSLENQGWGDRVRIIGNVNLNGNDNVSSIREAFIGYKHHYFSAKWKRMPVSVDGSPGDQDFNCSVLLPGPWLDAKTDVVFGVEFIDGSIFTTELESHRSKTPWTWIFSLLVAFALLGLMVSWLKKMELSLLVRGADPVKDDAGATKSESARGIRERVHRTFEKLWMWVKSARRDEILVLRCAVLTCTEVIVILSLGLKWIGAGFNDTTLFFSPIDIVNKELGWYLGSANIIIGLLFIPHGIAILITLHAPKVAAALNTILAVGIVVLVPVVKNFVLSLPEDPVLGSLVIEAQVGVYVTIIVSIVQIVLAVLFKKWIKRISTAGGEITKQGITFD
ncbi:MAG: hypothetical protein ACTSU9_03090 [Promethearchaeota archaeon]